MVRRMLLANSQTSLKATYYWQIWSAFDAQLRQSQEFANYLTCRKSWKHAVIGMWKGLIHTTQEVIEQIDQAYGIKQYAVTRSLRNCSLGQFIK